MTSKVDAKRYDKLRQHGCIACRIDGRYGEPDMHHLVDKGYRKHSGGNRSTLPLCVWHHRGNVPEGHTIASATESFGPSMHHQSKAFRARYGSQRELLQRVDETIGVAA